MKDRYKDGIINFRELIKIKPYHTLSINVENSIDKNIYIFALAKDTDISEEKYDDQKFYVNLDGDVTIGNKRLLKYDAIFLTGINSYGISVKSDSYLMEISFDKKEEDMLKLENKGEIFNLKNVIEYVDGGISNYDVFSRDDLKIVLMAFDEGEGLTPHTAPGDALIFALEGEADMMVKDEVYRIKEGEQIVFPKGERHNVTAVTKFKMALILVK